MVLVLGWSGLRSEDGYGDNGLSLTGYGGIGPAVVLVPGNGRREEPVEKQQSLFSWAELPGLHRGRLWPRSR